MQLVCEELIFIRVRARCGTNHIQLSDNYSLLSAVSEAHVNAYKVYFVENGVNRGAVWRHARYPRGLLLNLSMYSTLPRLLRGLSRLP